MLSCSRVLVIHMTQAKAQLRFLQMAPRKVRLIAASIRGLSVNEAESQLVFRSKRAAGPILKLLRSAVANAKQAKMDPAKLVVTKITVDQGPMLKRSLPRAMGRATPIHKKMSHIILVLEESSKAGKPRFNIIKKEKAAKPEKEIKAKPKEAKKPELKTVSKAEKQSFFKRIFKKTNV